MAWIRRLTRSGTGTRRTIHYSELPRYHLWSRQSRRGLTKTRRFRTMDSSSTKTTRDSQLVAQGMLTAARTMARLAAQLARSSTHPTIPSVRSAKHPSEEDLWMRRADLWSIFTYLQNTLKTTKHWLTFAVYLLKSHLNLSSINSKHHISTFIYLKI